MAELCDKARSWPSRARPRPTPGPKIRLRGVNRCRWQHFSSKFELCEPDADQPFLRTLGLLRVLPTRADPPAASKASGSPVACFLVLDTSFTRLSFYPADGSRHVLLLRDLAEPSRGKALSCGLSSPERCVAVGIVQEPRRFVCLFDDSEEADNFFTCITILRLALRVPIPGPV